MGKDTSISKMKSERLRRRWSQQELAVFARVGVADVSRIETGRIRPYPSQAQKLAHVLGLKPEELQEPVEIDCLGVKGRLKDSFRSFIDRRKYEE